MKTELSINNHHYNLINDLKLSRIQRYKLLRIYELIRKKQIKNKGNIHSLIFNNKMQDYKKHLNYLEDLNIIKIDDSYLVGEFTKSYEIVEDLNMSRDIALVDLEKYKKMELITKSYLNTAIDNLVKPIPRLRFDEAAYYMEHEHIFVNSDHPEFTQHLYRSHIITEIYEIYNSLSNGFFSGENGRFYSLFTNLPKRAKEIILKGFVEIDISNSQLYFFALYLKEHQEVWPRDHTNVLEFIKHSFNGTLYEQFNLPRREAKQNTITTLFLSAYRETYKGSKEYSNNVRIYKYSSEEMFISKFPDVYDIIWKIKLKHPDAHRDFAILLQKIESDYVIHGVARKAIKQRMHLVSIHDSVIVKKIHTDKVLKIFDDTFPEDKPTLTVKEL